jgi:hypothetical protein
MGRMGEPPSGALDYVIVLVAVLAVVVPTGKAVWWLLGPGETEPDHIKRAVLDDAAPDRVT